MNVERLRAVQAEEREADSLRPLPEAFYREVAEYLGELRAERAAAAETATDPFDSAEVRRLTDEIETAEEVAEAIYERRVGKLVKRASLAAAGMPADREGLTVEEAELFDDLVAEIEAHRESVLATFGGDRPRTDAGGSPGPAGASDGVGDTDPAADDPTMDAAAAMGAGSPDEPDADSTESSGSDHPAADGPDGGSPDDAEPTIEPGSRPGSATDESSESVTDESSESATDDGPDSTDGGAPARVTVRITRDVGEVFGVDERTYDLAAEDVVTLPAANARPLLDRDAAEELE